jgi:hypothetical protein
VDLIYLDLLTTEKLRAGLSEGLIYFIVNQEIYSQNNTGNEQWIKESTEPGPGSGE